MVIVVARERTEGDVLPTSMKKIEIYSNNSSCSKIHGVLDDYKVYWYVEDVVLRGERRLCKTTLYVPVHVVGKLVADLAPQLDFRKLDNMIVVSDVEAGIGAPYRLTSRRRLIDPPPLAGRPWFMLREEADDKAKVTLIQIALAAIASLVALAGLVHDNPYIIIGAMLLSPIMAPIYSFSITLISKNRRTALKALTSLSLLLTAALVSALLATITANLLGFETSLTNELLMRTQLGWDMVTIPLLLGAATIIASASDVAEALIGVAIAAALIPPTATAGWALAAGETMLAAKAITNLLANLLGLLVGGTAAGIALHRIIRTRSQPKQ